MATGVPVSEFSGGGESGQANAYASTQWDAKVVPLRSRNPDWDRDELVLALDLYLRHRASPPGKASREIADLSETLNQLAAALGHHRGVKYRNTNGVYMKLMNFRSLDPDYTREGKVGLQGIGHGDREAWAELAHDPSRCASVAAAIVKSLANPEIRETTAADDPDEEFAEAEEGRLFTRLHRHRERSRKLVERKKKRALAREQVLRCECCGFNFAEAYGNHGAGFIECHHTRPVHLMEPGQTTSVDDLALVCANCHRMIHLRRPWLSVSDLKNMIARQKMR
jgi:5-methylcytosine-specific restriction protein A